MTKTLRKFLQNNSMNPRGPMITSPQGLRIHKDSRVISKIQPKIRIIHIFAPEIIHTDVAYFPETVQRLTGKSSSSTAPTSSSGSVPKKSTAININTNPRASKLPIESHRNIDHDHHHGIYGHDRHHHGYDHGGLFDDLQAVNGFMQAMDEFPFVSMEANHHHHHNNHHLNGYEETHPSLSYRG